MTNAFYKGSYVVTSEHLGAVGQVVFIHPNGGLSVAFTSPATESMPFAHICTEFWPVSEFHLLQEVAA